MKINNYTIGQSVYYLERVGKTNTFLLMLTVSAVCLKATLDWVEHKLSGTSKQLHTWNNEKLLQTCLIELSHVQSKDKTDCISVY